MPPPLINEQAADRSRFTDLILASDARKKVVIAGAGTGKTFTFKKVLEAVTGNRLALTFINNLAFDLQKELSGLADAYTFHAYCKKLLHRIAAGGIGIDFEYFPKLELIVESDAAVFGYDANRFNRKSVGEAFRTLTEDDRIDFFIVRGNFYNAVGHDDTVYRTLKHFQAHPENLEVFSQVVVDEYQDFNQLEVAFIEELAKRSPILIVGDDDQAVYDFKNASPYHIRSKANDAGFERFELPYCSRCPQVVVDSVHAVAQSAFTNGRLQNRFPKNYYCYLPDKEADSQRFPSITHVHTSVQMKKANYTGKFIEREVLSIAAADIQEAWNGKYPTVLIAGPKHYLGQVYDYLKDKFPNIDYKEPPDDELTPIDGYQILLSNNQSNLGWRIVLEFFGEKETTLLAAQESQQSIFELLDPAYIREHISVVEVLRKLNGHEDLLEEEWVLASTYLQLTRDEIQEKFLSQEDLPIVEEDYVVQPPQITIKMTTLNGCKGLSAGHVFLVGMNDGDFPRTPGNPTDNEICQFIVGITRTRKRCYLVSNGRFGITWKTPSTLIGWLNPSSVVRVTADRAYFTATDV